MSAANKEVNHRITVNLTPTNNRSMEELAEIHELSKTDVINRALGLYRWWTTQEQEGAKHLLLTSAGKTETVKLL